MRITLLVCGMSVMFSVAVAHGSGPEDEEETKPRIALRSVPNDLTEPDAVQNLHAVLVTPWSVILSWTAPGDDGADGIADLYDIRMAEGVLDDGKAQWEITYEATGPFAPGLSGSQEACTVSGLEPLTEYSFLLKTSDEVPLWSDPSNIVTVTTPDDLGVLLVSPDGNAEFSTIQAAIDAATAGELDPGFPGRFIILADGVYRGSGNRGLNFRGKRVSLISLSGNPAACIIDCEGEDRGFSRFPMLPYLDPQRGGLGPPRIQGLTIRNGQDEDGGGVLCDRARVLFVQCHFINNYASNGSGGAIAFEKGAGTFVQCIFERNEAAEVGGAVSLYRSTCDFRRCEFRGNMAERGGAVAAVESALPPVWEPLPAFQDSLLNFHSCLIYANHANESGGAIHCSDADLTVNQCTLSHNRAIDTGGAIHCRRECRVEMVNSIISFSSNVSDVIHCDGGDILIFLACCNLYRNEDGNYVGCIKGRDSQGGNISVNPLFRDAQAGDFHLSKDSPCAPLRGYDCIFYGSYGAHLW
ncbi:MAG: hypothetical protein KAY24_18535 [Candidatus Eisenbacteria sp.]|nr:hypothetical protein [Candidatus Eisenbacteria bacterium]